MNIEQKKLYDIMAGDTIPAKASCPVEVDHKRLVGPCLGPQDDT